MLISLLSVATVVILLAVPTSGQKPCCSPDKWTAHLMQKTGAYNSATFTASKADVDVYIFYDYTTKQMATNAAVRNATFKSYSYIQRIWDFNKGLEWIIDGVDGKNCTRHQVTEAMPPPCFLDGADFFGYHNLIDLAVEVWFRDDGKGHTSRTTMSRDPCVLVTETTRSMGPGLDYVLSFGIYENVTTGYVDPSMFTVPSFCPRAGQVNLEYPKQTPVWPWHLPAKYLVGP